MSAAVNRCTAYMFAATAMLACGDPSPVAPPIARDAIAADAKQQSRSKVLKRSTALKQELVASATITPDGGTISIDEAGLIVAFPPGAVSSSLIVMVTAHRGNRVLYTLEPHGIHFDRPIAIAQLLSATERATKRRALESGVHGGYLAAGTGAVDAAGLAAFDESFPVTFDDGTAGTYAVFRTWHFSGYALASGAH